MQFKKSSNSFFFGKIYLPQQWCNIFLFPYHRNQYACFRKQVLISLFCFVSLKMNSNSILFVQLRYRLLFGEKKVFFLRHSKSSLAIKNEVQTSWRHQFCGQWSQAQFFQSQVSVLRTLQNCFGHIVIKLLKLEFCPDIFSIV